MTEIEPRLVLELVAIARSVRAAIVIAVEEGGLRAPTRPARRLVTVIERLDRVALDYLGAAEPNAIDDRQLALF